MFRYYLDLALRSFKRNRVLTALMVLALGLGIGASITTLTVLKLLSGDPPPQVPGQHPFFSDGVITTSDFFSMFGASFQYGSGWGANDDENRAHVIVIAGFLNDKLFGGSNSVGKILRVNDHDYRIVGVLKPWAPQPRFYAVNLGGRGYGKGDALFMPLQAAIADKVNTQTVNCFDSDVDIDHLETAPCVWVSTWVELANASDAKAYKTFLSNYAAQQISLG